MRYSRRAEADAEHEAWLHVQHAEWFATTYQLKMEEKRWQQRLENVADQNLVIGDAARQSFAAYSIHDNGTEGGSAFARHVLFLLGLNGFAKDEEQALTSDCVHTTPIKEIFRQTSAMRQLWDWPFNHIAAFTLGLELVLVSIFFVPIALWIRVGDLRVSGTYIRRSIMGLVAKTMTLHQRKFIPDTVSAVRERIGRLMSDDDKTYVDAEQPGIHERWSGCFDGLHHITKRLCWPGTGWLLNRRYERPLR